MSLNGDGLVDHGHCGYHECWHDWQDGTEHLGETCETAYLLRLCDELSSARASRCYGDLMERGIYNALFAAQSPDGRRLRYYVPLEAPRKYFDGDRYCCPCNFRRIVSELPTMIYYGRRGGVAVNLYTPSTAAVPFAEGKKVKRRPGNGLSQQRAHALTIGDGGDGECFYLRKPRWAKSAAMRVNGQDGGPRRRLVESLLEADAQMESR